mmetsp:Transcript_3360/g.15011  ORF Transcript_3360/g.15011 Transcript_3360/m.15011 type:complete len:298 (-) Transcript_3360:12-905(-)
MTDDARAASAARRFSSKSLARFAAVSALNLRFSSEARRVSSETRMLTSASDLRRRSSSSSRRRESSSARFAASASSRRVSAAAMIADCSARTASLALRWRSRFASSSRLNRSTSAATAAAISAFSSFARCLRRSMRDICWSSSRRCAATARFSSALISACCRAYTSISKRDMMAQSLLDCSPTLRVTPPSEGRPVREAAYLGGGARATAEAALLRAVELTSTDWEPREDRGAGSAGLSPVTNMFASWVSNTMLRVFAADLDDIFTLFARVPLRVSASSLAWSRARLASSIGGIVSRV